MKLNNASNNSKLRNDEHFQFITEFKQTVEKFPAVKAKIDSQMKQFNILYAREDEALKKINKSAFTKEIQDEDNYRDQIFRGMTNMVKTLTFHFNKEKQDAARKLKIVLDTYGNLAPKALSEQTSGVYNLLQDLRARRAEVDLTGIAEWLDELEASNNNVSRLMMDRYEETAQKTDVVLIQARTEIDAVYRETAERINALVLIEGAENYAEFIKLVNTIIARFNTILAQRAGRSRKKRENAAEGETENNYLET